ncbi:MAG: copper chaperone PCu(A)C [Chloroflexi bacterium]|nr:copper chaperone PCu(A)C [Chloroflexota bacterium]
MQAIRLRTILLLFIVLLAGCRQRRLSSADVQLELSASDQRVGETTLLLRVTDRDGAAVNDPGQLSVRGDMDHAGMVPVLAEADSSEDGVFSLPFEWTMGGGWIVEARLTLPNGDVALETFRFEILSEATEAGTMNMGHGETPGESSAAYLRIQNRGEGDVTLVSATSAAAAELSFHRTVADGDMARMEAVNSVLIPAGETVDLAPGGLHIMLLDLQADLPPESALTLRLACDSGETYDLDFPVMTMRMGELDDEVAIGDLVFSQRWARPAQAGGMTNHAQMHDSATPSN